MILAIRLLALALPVKLGSAASIQKRDLFGMDTFSDRNCQYFDEFIEVGAIGANSNPFPGPRSSFLVINTSGVCEVILWNGTFSGTKVTYSVSSLYDNLCFGGNWGLSYRTFDIHCFDEPTTGPVVGSTAAPVPPQSSG